MNFLSSLFGGIKNLFSGASQGISNMFGGGGSGASNMQSAMGGPNSFSKGAGAASQWGNIGGNIGKGVSPTSYGGGTDWMSQLFPGGKAAGVAGLAAPIMGNMFAPKTKTPDISGLQSVQAMRSFKPGNSVTPEYQQMIQNNVGRLREQKKRELDALYHNARPGTDYTTDTNYQRDLSNMDREIQGNLTDELQKAEGQFSQQEQDHLSQVAQLDVADIMMRTNLSFEEANQFKQMFSNVGNVFLTNATRKPGQFDLSSLFGAK